MNLMKDAYINSKISLIARDQKTKQIVSAIFARDWYSPLREINMENMSESF